MSVIELGLTPDVVASMLYRDSRMRLELKLRGLTTLEGLVVPDLVDDLHVELQNNRLSSLHGLEHATNLKVLLTCNNQLASLNGIEHLTNLTTLFVSDNQLTSLDGVEHLIELTRLAVFGNQLTSLDGVEHLNKLTRLSAASNQLSSLCGIESLTNLTVLWVGENQLSSLRGVESLTNLTQLFVADNQLTSLNGIERLVRLHFLDIAHNRLAELPIELTEIGHLYMTGYSGNPWIFPPASIMNFANWQGIRAYLTANRAEASLRSIRRRAEEICVGLQSLQLPALMTVEILDAAVPNSLDARLGAKWNLVCAVKHFHDRRAVSAKTCK